MPLIEMVEVDVARTSASGATDAAGVPAAAAAAAPAPAPPASAAGEAASPALEAGLCKRLYNRIPSFTVCHA